MNMPDARDWREYEVFVARMNRIITRLTWLGVATVVAVALWVCYVIIT
jgi:hypothetical protein